MCCSGKKTRCCYCCDVERCTLVLAVLGVAGGVAALAVFLAYGATSTPLILAPPVAVVVVNLVLLCAVCRHAKTLLAVYLVLQMGAIVGFVTCSVLVVLMFESVRNIDTTYALVIALAWVAGLVLNFYFWKVVYNFYKQLQGEERSATAKGASPTPPVSNMKHDGSNS